MSQQAPTQAYQGIAPGAPQQVTQQAPEVTAQYGYTGAQAPASPEANYQNNGAPLYQAQGAFWEQSQKEGASAACADVKTDAEAIQPETPKAPQGYAGGKADADPEAYKYLGAPQYQYQYQPAAPSEAQEAPQQFMYGPAAAPQGMYASAAPQQAFMYGPAAAPQQPMYGPASAPQQAFMYGSAAVPQGMYGPVAAPQQPMYGPAAAPQGMYAPSTPQQPLMYGPANAPQQPMDAPQANGHTCQHGAQQQAMDPQVQANMYSQQLMDMCNDLMQGKADPAKIANFLTSTGTHFWKGAIVGAGLTFLLTNSAVKSAISDTVKSVFGGSKGA